MAPPDLADPAARNAYREELRGVARPLRFAGLGIALLGGVLSVGRAYGWGWVPEWLPMGLLAVAVALIVTAIAARTRYHARRMRGD